MSQTATKAATFERPNQKMLPKLYIPLANSNPLPSKVNMVFAVAQRGEICHGWGNIKVGGEWAMSGLEGTMPPTTKTNWCE